MLDSFDLAAEYAKKFRLGNQIAELEVPDDVQRLPSDRRGHWDLIETSPDELRSYVVQVRNIEVG